MKTNPAYLATFNKLFSANKSLIAKFTDDAAGSTLSKFLDDCTDDVINTINANPLFANAVVGHKTGWTIDNYGAFDDAIDELDALDDTTQFLSDQIKKSLGIAKFSDVITLGNNLSKNIKDALTLQLQSGSGALYNELAKLIGYNAVDATSMLAFQNYIKDFELLEEIPFVTTGGFMKADILLVKKNASGTAVVDAIIIENKLSAGTAFTHRQKEGFGAIIGGNTKMNLEYAKDGIKINDIIPVSKDKIFKFSDGGTDNISNVTGSKITSVK